MSSEIRHTPLPWKTWTSPLGEAVIKATYRDENGLRITAWPAVCNCGGQDNEANADLIVRAVNSHQKLVEALEGLLTCHARYTGEPGHDAAVWSKAEDVALAALAAARTPETGER